MKPFSIPPSLRIFIYQRATLANAQRRNIQLWRSYKSSMDRNPEVAQFRPFIDHRPASRVFVNLKLDEESPVQRLSLENILENVLKPGHVLVPFPNPLGSDARTTRYTIKNATLVRRLDTGNHPFTNHRMLNAKLLHFSRATTPAYLYESLQAAMKSLREGFTIEIHVHSGNKANGRKIGRIIDTCIHLRPDVILRAMPRKSGIIISPQTDDKVVCWVMAPPFVRNGKDLEIPLDQTHAYQRKRERLVEKLRMDEGKAEAKPTMPVQEYMDGVTAIEEHDVGTELIGTSAEYLDAKQ